MILDFIRNNMGPQFDNINCLVIKPLIDVTPYERVFDLSKDQRTLTVRDIFFEREVILSNEENIGEYRITTNWNGDLDPEDGRLIEWVDIKVNSGDLKPLYNIDMKEPKTRLEVPWGRSTGAYWAALWYTTDMNRYIVIGYRHLMLPPINVDAFYNIELSANALNLWITRVIREVTYIVGNLWPVHHRSKLLTALHAALEEVPGGELEEEPTNETPELNFKLDTTALNPSPDGKDEEDDELPF